ncbi:MAG: GH39 family glycosyl hydrolase [Stackebrandtia sp.]
MRTLFRRRAANFKLKAITTGVAALALAITGTVGYAAYADAEDFQVGLTHGNTSPDVHESNPDSLDSAKKVMTDLGGLQNAHLMGWGTANPWPDQNSDKRDWASMDSRMKLITETEGTPVITLCTAPGWMKPSGDDWAMEEAPTKEHYDDYAKLAAETAQRYPDVKYFQVWNEFKGFWDEDANRWDYEGYTEFYNKVYKAVKEVSPNAELGGPYVSINTYKEESPAPSDLEGAWGNVDQRDLDAMDYWLKHNDGAEFFTVDGGTDTNDGYYPDAKESGDKFKAITEWIAARTELPVWWSEFYAFSAPDGPSSPEHMTSVLKGMNDGGASVALWWQPEESAPADSSPGLWTSTEEADGGKATEYTEVVKNA